MALNLTQLCQVQVASAVGSIYASPAPSAGGVIGTTTRIDKMTLCNTDSQPHTVQLYIVPAGGTASAANQTTFSRILAAGETWNSPNEVGQVMAAGGSIWASCDAPSVVTLTASGIQLSS